MANNIVLNPKLGDTIVLSAVAKSVISAQNQYGPTGSALYTGTITGGASNGLALKALTVAGFTNAANNGTFLVLSSTATTVTLSNTQAIAETTAATATYTVQGFPSQYASKIENLWSNQNGDSVTVNAQTGDCLVAVVLGLKSAGQFDLLHGSSPAFGYLQGLNDFNANPTVTDASSGATPASVTAVSIAKNTFALTAVNSIANITATSAASTSYVLASAANHSGATTVYTGTIVAAAGSLVGVQFVVSGFDLAANNGTFTCTANNGTTTITLNNGAGVADTHAATAVDNILTITATNTFSAGQAVLIQGTSEALLNGQTYTIIAGGLTGSVLRANYTGGAFTNASDTGTAAQVSTSASPNAIYTGTGLSALAGYYVTISGFSNSANNGTFLVSASGATTLTVSNANAVGQVAQVASAVDFVLTLTVTNTFTVGQSPLLAGFAGASFLNGQSPAIVTRTGSQYTTNYPNYVENYTGTEAAATATLQGGNVWTLAVNSNIIDSDYTVASTPPAAPNPFPSAKWNLDGYYPSIYVFVAPNVAAGSYKVTLNSMYQPGIDDPTDWSGGAVPIFDGGVNFQVYNLSGVATASPVESSSISLTDISSNPATAPASLTVANADGDALISIGLMKSGNAMAAGTVNVTTPPSGGPAIGAAMTTIGSGRLINSEAHYIVEYGLVTAGGSPYQPNFSNPLGYQMLVASIAIKST